MGGAGAGHKSLRAREARLVNIKKARAARKRAPLPWRSLAESRVIERLVWQWWMSAKANSGSSFTKGAKGKERPWAKYRVARFLSVSHTWVHKLVRRFEADPDGARRRMEAFAPATFKKLRQARAETLWQREHNRLRGPIRYRRVKVTIEGRKRKVIVTTAAEARRLKGRSAAPAMVHDEEIPGWAKGFLPPEAGAAQHASRAVPFAFRRRR
jgi:hypothetical protein